LAVQGSLGITQKRTTDILVVLQKLSVPSGFSGVQRAESPLVGNPLANTALNASRPYLGNQPWVCGGLAPNPTRRINLALDGLPIVGWGRQSLDVDYHPIDYLKLPEREDSRW
jgi:hypothetical protein